jgi:hypothetical protein
MVFLSGCAGVQVSKFTYDDSYQVNKPIKGEKCYDASVLLGVDINRARDIAKKALVAVDSTISEETDILIKAQRNRHIGVFVGSGGEKISISLKEAGENKTFMAITTKTGFVGGAGQKAWSCQILDEVVKMASK